MLAQPVYQRQGAEDEDLYRPVGKVPRGLMIRRRGIGDHGEGN
jgi:hypothetical protein